MRIHTFTQLTIALATAWGGCNAFAAEQYNVRMNPGAIGRDIISPTLPGHFGAVNLVFTNSDKLVGEDGEQLVVRQTVGPNSVPVSVDFKQKQTNLLFRYAYISEAQWLGAKLGISALVFYGIKDREVSLTPNFAASTPGIPPAQAQRGLINNLNTQAAASTGGGDGLGDIEVSPVLAWESETTKITFSPTVIFPTGKYDKNDGAGSIGQGNFYTFRPSVGYGRVINDNWNGGVRLTYGVNTKNKDTDYKSGDFLALDGVIYTALNGLNVGLNLYHLEQLSADKAPTGVAAIGKLSLSGAGLNLAFNTPVGNAEIKFNQDLRSKNTREGYQLILRLSTAF